MHRILVGTNHDDIYAGVEMIVRNHLEARGGVEAVRVTRCDECVLQASSGNFALVVFFGQTLLPGGRYTGGYMECAPRAIRAIKANATTPILCLSSLPEVGGSWLAAGADAFLETPYTVEEFTSAVDRCVKRT